MTGIVTGWIGLGLDDAAGLTAFGAIAHQNFAQQKFGEHDRTLW